MTGTDSEDADDVLASGNRLCTQQYNYDEAIKLLKGQKDFDSNQGLYGSGSQMSGCQVCTGRISTGADHTCIFSYTDLRIQSRAFDGDSKSGNYNQVMTTVSEFNKIIQILV